MMRVKCAVEEIDNDSGRVSSSEKLIETVMYAE